MSDQLELIAENDDYQIDLIFDKNLSNNVRLRIKDLNKNSSVTHYLKIVKYR